MTWTQTRPPGAPVAADATAAGEPDLSPADPGASGTTAPGPAASGDTATGLPTARSSARSECESAYAYDDFRSAPSSSAYRRSQAPRASPTRGGSAR